MSFDSSTVAGGDTVTATKNNDLRRDIVENAGDYASSTGSANAFILAIDSQVVSAYSEKQVFKFKANFANTGPATLNVNTLGAKTIKKHHDQDLEADDIKVGQVVIVMYDGTDLQLLSQLGTFITTADKATLTDGSNADVQHVHGYSERADTSTSLITINDATLTNLLSFTVPADKLGTLNGVKFKLYVSDVDWASNTLTIRLRYGSTTIASASLSNGVVTNDVGDIEGVLLASGATGTQSGVLKVELEQPSNSAADTIIAVNSGTGAEDSTGALTFTVDAQWSGGSSNLVVAYGYAEYLVS